MINLLNYFLEANIILVVFALVYYALIRIQSDFQLRRMYILLAIVSAGLIPFITFNNILISANFQFLSSTIPTFTLPEFVVGHELSQGHFHSSEIILNRPLYMFWAYAVIVSLLLLRFLVQLFYLFYLVRSGNTHRVRKEKYVLLENDRVNATFSFFNFMFLGSIQSLNEIEKAQIISHEEVHINQWHSLDLILLEIARAVFWVNPVVWFFRKEQNENHEYIADLRASVLHDKVAYQQLLVKMTLGQFQPVGNYFAKIQTLKRIDMMNKKQTKIGLFPLASAGAVCVSVLVFIACNDDIIEASISNSQPLEGKIIEVPADQSFTQQEFDDEIFDIVENQPAPVGGMREFYKFIANNIRYPQTARQKGIEGRVFIQFVVDTEGKLTKIKTVKGVGAGCDEEAVRVLEGAPNWNPGKQRGRTVNVRMILPITFKINKPEESTQNDNSKRLDKIEAPQMEELVVIGFQGK